MTISLCMIVKNEEAVLARCLDSLSGLMDEMIIVDTGSSDATKDIAISYGAKVYDYVWNDDFSAARNFAFSHASCDYIYSADADEVLEEKDRALFKKLKVVLLPEIDIVQMLYTNQLKYNTTYNFDEELRPKLFKRVRNFVWEDPLHEAVRLSPVIYDSDIRIKHCPVSEHHSRDFALMQGVIARDGGLSVRLHKMYARELFITGYDEDFLKAEAYFRNSMDKDQDLDQAPRHVQLHVQDRHLDQVSDRLRDQLRDQRHVRLQDLLRDECLQEGSVTYEKSVIINSIIRGNFC